MAAGLTYLSVFLIIPLVPFYLKRFGGDGIHVFGPSMLNELRFSWVRRDIDQVENDPDSPTASITAFRSAYHSSVLDATACNGLQSVTPVLLHALAQ